MERIGKVIALLFLTANVAFGQYTVGSRSFASSTQLVNSVIRGTSLVAVNATTYTVTLPAGSVEGDFAVLFCGTGYPCPATIAGWTVNDYQNVGSYWSGAVYSKVLTSGDISTGSASVTSAGAYDGVVGLAVIVGAAGGVREVESSRHSNDSTTSVSLTTSTNVAVTDTNIYFASERGNSSSITVSRGIKQQAATDSSNGSGVVFGEQLTGAGALTATFVYSSGNLGNYSAVVVVTGHP
jgi:hypothetical protein